ncbi:MAG TPA: response regulator [Candidatus Omnitrophota bacterium]|nr:response regulator [Candidatus Omnitrophota bacterium]HPS19396.1 response regulator [Candidatus Omnitrophota bacterium]
MWKILIVDDEATNRKLLRHQIGPDFACDEAPNGAVALDAYQMAKKLNSPYIAIFLDILMPVVDGIQVLKNIRNTEKQSGVTKKNSVAIIVLTAHPEHMPECQQHGVDDFLTKPYNPYIIISTLQKCIDARKE